MILYYSSGIQGGILQLSCQLLNSSLKITDALLIVPESALGKCPETLQAGVVSYPEQRKFTLSSLQLNCINRILEEQNPDKVIFTSPSYSSYQVSTMIRDRIPFDTIVHDVTPHSTRSMKKKTAFLLGGYARRRLFSCSSSVVTLSENSRRQFAGLYPKYVSKLKMIPLGAHVPECESKVPPECANFRPYLLFFGRLDKQKGIDLLLEAYGKSKCSSVYDLIIAGKGYLSEHERRMASNDENVVLIERFIDDSEMLWLFENASAVCLPYRDATQSGVLPIAYRFGKCVIATDIEGIREFVIPGVTGLLASDSNAYTKQLDWVSDNSSCLEELGKNAKGFYVEHLDWDKNIVELL